MVQAAWLFYYGPRTYIHVKGYSRQERGIHVKQLILKLIFKLVFKNKFQTLCEYSVVA